MVAADPSLFQTEGGLQRKAAKVVVAALLASESKVGSPQNPWVLEPEAEGGGAQCPPQRDKQPRRFNLGTSLQEQEQIKVLAMLDDNMDRFAFSLEDIHPQDFTGEPMRINLNSDQAVPPTNWDRWSGILWRGNVKSCRPWASFSGQHNQRTHRPPWS